MSFEGLESRAVSRSLAQIADEPDDRVDAYFERLEEVEAPTDETPLGMRVRREEGLSVRLLRGRRVWASSRDELTSSAFNDAVRQVARTVPQAIYTPPAFELEPLPPAPIEPLLGFPAEVDRRIRELDAAFENRLRLRRHRRESFVVGTRFAADPQAELYFSVEARTTWGRFGALLPDLGAASVDLVASALVGLFRSRRAPAPEPGERVLVLGPSAAAVVLHEAVAHALEADTLALTGRPEAAIGVPLAGATVSVIDDPNQAPPSVRRTFDDEGSPAVRRWLLREGVVDQPLADALHAGGTEALAPGCGRRSGRHELPGPRSTHLELAPGETAIEELCDEGLYFEQVERGALDPWSGRFEVVFPWGRRLSGGRKGEFIGRCRLSAPVADLLGSIVAVGRDPQPAGAGWCAKGGQLLPVWATAPGLRIDGLGVTGA